jgi:hypothetical protein
MLGYALICFDMLGDAWGCLGMLEMLGNAWGCLGLVVYACLCSGIFMGMLGYACICSGYAWICMDMHGDV